MTTITIERAILDRLIDAWDSTVLPKSRDGMMQERMEDLRAALAAPATAPDRHAQELLAQDITIANMRERHAQELCAYSVTVDKLRAEIDRLQAQLVRQQASYEAEIKVEIDAALERAAAEVVLLDKKHWFSKQSRFAEFLAYAIRALKESQDDPGYVDDVTNHDDAVVTPLYQMAVPAGHALAPVTGITATPTTQAAPVAQGDTLTDTYVQQVPDKCDRIVWRGRYYHLPIDAAEHSYTEPSPMAKVAAALRQKAEQEDAAYQARRSDQGLMESEWGPMEDAPPHEDPPMHVAVVEGDDTVRTLQWNRDVAAFAYPAGTLLYAARSQAKKGGAW